MSKETKHQNYAVSHVNSIPVLSREKYLLYSILISCSGLVDCYQPDLIYEVIVQTRKQLKQGSSNQGYSKTTK